MVHILKIRAMRKIIAAINMTLDGHCDHTAIEPDEEIHRHYQELLESGGAILYGRKTYELMEFWRTLLDTPSEDQSMNDFAVAIDRIPKVVFSETLEQVDWKTATLAKRDLSEVVHEFKQSKDEGCGDVYVGSRSLIIQLLDLNLIDEFQLCVHPVLAGGGLPLFENLTERKVMKLSKTKNFAGGAVILYYVPVE